MIAFALSGLLAVSVTLDAQDSTDQESREEAAISALENSRRGIARHDLQHSVDVIRTESRRGDEAVWMRLRGIVENGRIPRDVRKEALQLACEKADDPIAREIIAMASDWASTTPGAEHELETRGLLISVICGEGLSWLEAALTDQSPLLHLLAQRDCVRAIANNPGPVALRRQFALDILGRTRTKTSPIDDFLPLLDESSFPALREMVRSSDDPFQFHYCAAATLAYLGDTQIKTDLTARRERFGAASATFREMLDQWIWQIDVQNPKSNLAGFIASTTDSETILPIRRLFAIQRAKELGVPVDEIRNAVLVHASRVTASDSQSAKSGLRVVKYRAKELGILAPSDLPDVSDPPFIGLRTDTRISDQTATSENSLQPLASSESKPARQPWHSSWRPNDANYEAFADWLAAIDWDAVPEVEALDLMIDKMCELDLIDPDKCEPQGPPGP